VTQYGYAFLGLTVIVAVFAGILTFALLRLIAGVRDARRRMRDTGGSEVAILSGALQEAVGKLRAQEQAMSARAAASERLSHLIVESLTAGLLVVDANGRVEILNPAARRLLEIGSDAVGLPYDELLTNATPLRDVIAEGLHGGRPIVRRSIQIAANGRASHFGVSVSPLGSGQDHGVICLFSDLTNVVELEEQLRLKETLARLGELTAGIAHEFRNGLATIHGYSRLIDPASMPATYRPYVEGIRQEADTLGQIVTNFLNFARPEKLSFAPVDLGRVARRAADDLRQELPERTRVEVSGEFALTDGDEVLLRQVFGNLIRNAAEACVAAGIEPSIAIRGTIEAPRRASKVSVEDNGPGIPQADRERVFQPFFTTRARGTGLGLSLVQKIVVMHNGRVTVGESPAGGAGIELTFPASELPASR
jgi:PAS domain S-box-containing protein